MKILRFTALILLSAMIILAVPTHCSAECGCNWFIKRCGKSQPKIPSELADKLTEDCYYLDTKLNDHSADKVIYLTFDAGYENGNVEKILDVLKEENVPGAFFVLDHIVLKNTDLVKRMAAEGHLVCNHTKNHKDMTSVSREEMIKNLTDLEKIYEEKTGNSLSKFFRFPEGRFNKESIEVASELGYKTVFWSLAYADWDNERQPDTEKSIKLLLDNTHNGAIVLLHPTSKTNALILPKLIQSWREMGYRFGTLDELVSKVK